MTPLELEELVHKAQEGDPDATSKVMEYIYPHLVRMAWRVLEDGDQADDAAQEAMIRIWKYLWTYARQDFMVWCRRILYNAAFDVRKAELEHQTGHVDEEQAEEYPLLNEVFLYEDVDIVMRQVLSPLLYKVMSLAIFKEYSPRDIAEELNMTMSSVYQAISRSRRLLKEGIKCVV